MSDTLFLAILALFIVGSLLSTAITQRDCMAIKRVESNMRWRQWMLVCSDAVQIGFLLFGIASVIQNRPGRVELAITSTLQCMACTNVRLSLLYLHITDSTVHATSPTRLLGGLVAACNPRGASAIYRAQRRSYSRNVSEDLIWRILIDGPRYGDAPAIYEAVLLVMIYAGSAFMARFGSSRLREHESSGGSLNRDMKYLFMTVSFANEIAGPIACIGIGVLVVLLLRGEAELRIRTITILVSELFCLDLTC